MNLRGLPIGWSFFGYLAVEIVFSKPAGLIFYLGSAVILCWTWLRISGCSGNGRDIFSCMFFRMFLAVASGRSGRRHPASVM